MTATTTLIGREASYARRILVRDPQNLFFTVGLPLLYLFIFATIFGSKDALIPGQPGLVNEATAITASVIVIGVVSAAFQNLVIALVQDRENGVLKRLRSTPVPTKVFIGGHVTNALMLSLMLAAGVAALGFAIYGVPFPDRRLLALVVTVIVGAVACSAIAFPFTRLVNKSTAATPMAVAVTLTLFFLSGNFFPDVDMPRAMVLIADLFPVRPFNQATLTALNPNTQGWGFSWDRLAVLAAWAVAATAIGPRTFRWTPHSEH